MTLSSRATEIVAAAREVLEREGRDALTMRRLGDVLGIKAPSIYKHLTDKHAIEAILIESGLQEMGQACHRVVRTGPRPTVIARLLAAYRRYALAHPNLYRLATGGRLDRDALTPGLEEWAGTPFYLAAGDDPYLAQGLWSYAHGMVMLELDNRYPEDSDLDQTWKAGAAAFTTAVTARSLSA